MNMVTVRYLGQFSAFTGGVKEESLEAASVKDVLKLIRERHGREAEKAARTMIIALNGENILLLQRYKTELKAGDVLSFFPLSAGG